MLYYIMKRGEKVAAKMGRPTAKVIKPMVKTIGPTTGMVENACVVKSPPV